MPDRWLGDPRGGRQERPGRSGGRQGGKRRPPDRPPDNKPGDVWTWRRIRCPACHKRGRKATDLRTTNSGSPTSYHVCLKCGWRFAATEEIDFEAQAGGEPPTA